jgi:hypothetical protein
MSWPGLAFTPSSQSAVLLPQGDHISGSLGVGFVGPEMVSKLDTVALSLASSSESRAFSLLKGSGSQKDLMGAAGEKGA